MTSSAPVASSAAATSATSSSPTSPIGSVPVKGAAISDTRVLVVDDYSTMRRIVGSLLRQLGFTSVDEAPDGVTALSMLRSQPYGLVISDWNMEPMTGLQLLREMRADVNLKSMPFIMVTTESKTDDVMVGKDAGISNFIVKPFNAASLGQKISSVGVSLPNG